MFDTEFYPTPTDLIQDMIWPYSTEFNSYTSSMNILEPSAWSGSILDIIKWRLWCNRNCRLFAIEKSPDLQATLRGKGYKLIDSDFLNYDKDMDFDLIIMNPPFSNGDEHFLKAWEIAENTDIVCILNAETIRNPYSEKRKLVQRIIEDNKGSVEFRENAFSSAERKTNVEIAIVRVTKITEKTHFSFDWLETEKIEMNEEILQNEIATMDMIQNIIDDYKRAREMFAEWMKLIYQSGKIASSISKNYELKEFEIAWWSGSLNDRYTLYIETFKQWIWSKIAEELKISKYMTSKLRDDFHKFMREQGTLAITHENIHAFADMVFSNRGNIMDNAITEAFDIFTKYYKENRVHIEWWKTNDSWKVNKKIILPNWISIWWSGWFNISYDAQSKMSDIDKALCYIDGKRFEDIVTIEKWLLKAFENNCDAESEFFTMKYYLKGTLHLTFKDLRLLNEFNMRACDGKQWLPQAEKDEWKKSKQKETGLIIY